MSIKTRWPAATEDTPRVRLYQLAVSAMRAGNRRMAEQYVECAGGSPTLFDGPVETVVHALQKEADRAIEETTTGHAIDEEQAAEAEEFEEKKAAKRRGRRKPDSESSE